MDAIDLDAQLAAVAARLRERRDSLLTRWRRQVAADPQVSAADSLSRAQFLDHIPLILDALYESLLAGRGSATATAAQRAQLGGGHGMHRWQQGYSLLEVMREWSHLQVALIAEMERLTAEHPGLDVRAINSAYRTIAVLCLEGMSESTVEFERMQRTEAAGQLGDLRQSLSDAREVERRQADILRSVAHDLRGNLGIVTSATAALNLDELPRERRAELFAMAQRALQAHTRLLSDLMDLARLKAGYERRRVVPTDASRLLRELCELTQPVAAERGLYLRFDGPPELNVETDAVKVGRIVQNLLLNALHYTQHGGVSVRWGPSDDADPLRWRIVVADTGPGIEQGSAAPLLGALEEAAEEARAVEPVPAACGDGPLIAQSVGISPPPRHGEGIGLSIVKRLCELLDATLVVESAPGVGTSFVVVLPSRYQQPPA